MHDHTNFSLALLPSGMIWGLVFGFGAAHLIPGIGRKLKLITTFLFISFMAIFGFIFDIIENHEYSINFLSSHLFIWLAGCVMIYFGVMLRLQLDKHLEGYYMERVKHRREYSNIPDNETNIRSISRQK